MWQEHFYIILYHIPFELVYITHIHMLFHCARYTTSQTTVKKDIKKEEAEELKAKLEAVGATIEIV